MTSVTGRHIHTSSVISGTLKVSYCRWHL